MIPGMPTEPRPPETETETSSPQDTREQLRIDRLEQATMRLSDQVGGLSQALAVVTELGRRQAEVEHRQQHVEQTTVPRQEVERTAAQIRGELAAHRRRMAWRLLLAGAAYVLAVGVVSAAVVQWVQGKDQSAYRQCLTTNEVRASLGDYYRAVAAQSTNPAIAVAAEDLQEALVMTDCQA